MKEIEIALFRNEYHPKQVLGNLFIFEGADILFQCKTIELPWKHNRRNESCVPADTYTLVLEYSPRFKRYLWELKNVPGRSETKFHVANFVRQLNGCIALGRYHRDIDKDGKRDVTYSASTINAFHKALSGLTEVELTIYGPL